jgi:hypothetical protein
MSIYSKLNNELEDFFSKKVHVAGTKAGDNIRILGNKSTNYEFSQWDMINLIDLYYNSKFESGVTDSEGQRKLFLNICKFRSDVASKQIDLDVKNFNFYPEDGVSEWPAFFLTKEFKIWAKENHFSELLNECVESFPKYGWIVLKEVKGVLEFVPLQTLRNQQDAKSLNTAEYVIIEHTDMSYTDITKMKGWDYEAIDLKYGETVTVYERYGAVSKKEYAEYKGESYKEGAENESIDCLTIMTMSKTKNKQTNEYDCTGTILFMEEIDERPFVEEHWSKQYGRLMGVGEIENQLENQIGANMSFNLFRRQLLWSAKKIFQSPDDGIAKNLVRDVKDGDVLSISPNGNITQVDMGNRAIGDFNSFQNVLEKNSDQKSFTYEASTGASMPSGTPFRLGVLLSNAVNSHFELKREKLALMFKRGLINLIIPKFKKEFTEERIISMFSDEEGFESLRQLSVVLNMSDFITKNLTSGNYEALVDLPTVRTQIEEQLSQARFLFARLPDDFYESLKYKVVLDITGESIDIPKKIETLTNVYTGMVQSQDPRAEKVLKRILSYAGENFDILAGPKPQVQPQLEPQGSAPKPTISTNNLPVKATQTI